MTGFFLRAAMASLGLWLASSLLAGLHFDSGGWLILAAILLGIVNALVRPLVVLLTLPLTVFSLGLFLLVVNGIMLWLVSALLPGFNIGGFWTAVWGALIVSVVGGLGTAVLRPSGTVHITINRR